jgi:hypothetical protein
MEEKQYLAKITFENGNGEQKIVLLANKGDEANGAVGIELLASEELAERSPEEYDMEGEDLFIGLAYAFVDFLGINAEKPV